MLVLLKIAIRNLFAHKLKTGIVGTLIFLGIFVIVLGNSFIDSAQRGIQKAYSQSITGEIAVLKQIDFDYSLFGTWADIGNLSVPRIPAYDRTLAYLRGHPGIQTVMPMSSGYGILNTTGDDNNSWLITFGIDPESYKAMFDVDETITISEGRFLAKDEQGVMLSRRFLEDLRKYQGISLGIGDQVVLNGYSKNGFRIRSVPLIGIYEFNYVKGEVFEMVSRTSLLDITTFRSLNGFSVESDGEDLAPDANEAALMTGDMDALFSSPVDELEPFSTRSADWEAVLGDTSVREKASKTDTKAWQWLLLRTRDVSDEGVKALVSELEMHFQEEFRTIRPEEIHDPRAIVSLLKNPRKPVYRELFERLSPQAKGFLAAWDGSQALPDSLKDVLAKDFNAVIRGAGLYDETRFQGIYLSAITRNLVQSKPSGEGLMRLNRLLLEELFPRSIEPGADMMVSEWWHAAAPISFITVAVQGLLNAGLLIVFIVLVIIIMNTLVISVMERTQEIGMMRAIGGQKGFILRLFMLETSLISLIFGTLGLIVGALVLFAAGQNGIDLTGMEFIRSILGADRFHPVLSGWTIGYSYAFMIVVGLLSSLYPVHFALKIRPIRAMQSE